jgi:PAS domain S-box-containing protein
MTRESASVFQPGPRRTGLSLRSKMVMGFCVPIAVTLLAVGLVSTFGIPFTTFEGTYGQDRADVLKNLSLVADLKKERFQLWLQERKDDVASLCEDQSVVSNISQLCEMSNEHASRRQSAEEPISSPLENSSYQDLLNEFRALAASHKVIDKIVVVDAKSGLILLSTKEKDVGLNVSRRAFFLTALREGSDESLDLEREPLQGKSYLIVSRVVKKESLENDGQTVIQAVVSMFVDTEEFLRPMLYTGGGLGETGEIVLVNQNRFIMMSLKYPLPDGRTPGALEHQIDAKPVRLAARGKEGMVIDRDYRNVPVLAAYRNLRVSPSQGWGMVVKRDQAEVFGPLWDQVLFLSLVGLAGLVCALIGGIIAANRISRPIKILSSTAGEVEAGNLNVRSPITSTDEVGLLAGTFNSMVERVQNWHRDLEEQVRNRTLQLNQANRELTAEIAQRKQAEQSLIKANRALRTLSDCNQTVIRFKSEEAMMTEVCRIMVEVGGYAMAWVGFAESDENKTVRPVAKFGLDNGYLDRMNITWADDENGGGPTGRCIRTQAPSIMRDAATHLDGGPWRDEEVKSSYLSSIALPMMNGGACFGALSIYATQSNAFDDDEVGLLNELAGDLSFGLMALRTEQRLQTSEAKYRELVEHSNSIIVKMDVTGKIVFLNDFGQEFFGYTQEDLLGQNMVAMLNPEHESTAGHLYSTIEKIVRNPQEHANIETEGMRKNGERVWISWTKKAIWERDGTVSGILAVGNDITRLKRAEHDLRESEERYRLLLDLSPDGVLAHSDGTVIFANRAAATLFGASDASALVGKPVLDLVDTDYKERVKDRIKHMNMGMPQPWIEEKFIRLDGTAVDVEVAAVPVAHSGRLLIQAIFRDISAQKRAQEVQRRLATAIEQAAETIEITDTKGTILYVNPAFERTTGFTSDEAIGANPRILQSGHHDDKFYKEMWATITNGKVWSGHLLNRKKDGTLLEEEATISPIKDDSGKIVSYVAVKRDVTKEVSLQKQLLQSQKMEAIGTLAGGIAHDFNNLLQVTQGYSELLLTEKQEDDPEYPDLLKVFQAAKNGAELVKQLLTFSRKLEPKPIPLNLNRQITQFETLLRRTIPKMIDIQLDLADSLEEINADPTQIELVFMNLAVNARDAMPDGGSLVVTTRNVTLDHEYCRLHVGTKPGRYVLLKISDTGEGMDEKTVQHIFEPFYTTKEIGRGTGLGLAMVYGIITQHGGYITCESERGRGTGFEIYLPAFETEKDSGDEQDSLLQAFGTETILVVDDEDLVRELAKRMLSKAGYTILAASNCREALDVYKKNKGSISLVILDLIMPEIGGQQCLDELLKIEPEVKVLVASGYAGDSSSRQAIARGAKGFISKPFRVKNLLSDVRKILDSQ